MTVDIRFPRRPGEQLAWYVEFQPLGDLRLIVTPSVVMLVWVFALIA